MDFSRPVSGIIETRSSWRSYNGKNLSVSDREKLQAFMDERAYNPYEGECGFSLIKIGEAAEGRGIRLGTYGVIKGCSEFIVGSAARGTYSHEHFGFAFEKLILHATDMGLGTCWIGGILRRELFARAAGIPDSRILPAISPAGYPADTRRIFEKGMRAVIRAEKSMRKPWGKIFFDGLFGSPLSPEVAGPYRKPLEMLRLGPSASNRQPWIIIREGERIFHFYYRPHSDIYRNFARLDIGIAVCHFHLTAEECGLKGGWVIREPALEKPDNVFYSISWMGEN